jgi:hypothetical protein
MKFGVFDRTDRGPGSLQEQYEQRFRLIEAYGSVDLFTV